MDYDKITIVLRDNRKSESKFLVEVNATGYDFTKAFKSFVRQANALNVEMLDDAVLDIYIGYWGTQGNFRLTNTFIEFCHRQSVKVEIDFND